MILGENDAASYLFRKNASIVSFTDIAGISNAMEKAVDESPEIRSAQATAIQDIVSSLDPAATIHQIISELHEVSNSR
jgi:trehalose-6-phosphate synthase